MQEAAIEFLAAGGNEQPSAADADPFSGLVAFGAGQNVAVWHPKSTHSPDNGTTLNTSAVQALLSGPTAPVTAVKFLHIGEQEAPVIISGSADSRIRVWRSCSREQSANGYRCSDVLDSHTKSINAIAILPDSHMFVSVSADSTVKLWRVASPTEAGEDSATGGSGTTLVQSISTKSFMIPMTITAAEIPGTDGVIIAVAGSKPSIQIYVAESRSADLLLAATLSGHEGWIRSLDFVVDPNSNNKQDLLLASASQDKYIRLWRVQRTGSAATTSASSKFDAMATMIGGAMSNKAHKFVIQETSFTVSFDALLVGHEDWVFSVRWLPSSTSLQLLSASADNSLALWQPEESSGVWTSTVRLGEISAQKGATTATGSTGGFWLGLWHDQGRAVLSLGKTGNWRMWRWQQDVDRWTQDVAVTGHTRTVEGLAWARNGSFLLSTSTDKTTRMWAQSTEDGVWHEFSRPQIHGYDLNCIDTISSTRFISGADEKLLRIFEMPRSTSTWLRQASGLETAVNGEAVEAANMPVLGLSNKAVDLNGDQLVGEEVETGPTAVNGNDQNATTKTHAPIEDQLSRELLWPEVEKLYGHGYEICACAVSQDGKLVATACKASSVTHAAIRIYTTSDWQLAQPPLEAHSLTVTRMRFSPDDQFLLSVSRDRQCAVYARSSTGAFKLAVNTMKRAHTRMVLDATWLPLTDTGRMFATAGRDKTVRLWRLKDSESSNTTIEEVQLLSHDLPVTAIDCHVKLVNGNALLAYGLEDGSIYTTAFSTTSTEHATKPLRIAASLAPSASITQLAWKPASDETDGILLLAAASEDCSLRVYRIAV